MDPGRGPRNRRVVEAARLHRARVRRETGKTIIEGPHLLVEAVSGGVFPEVVFALTTDEVSSALASRHGLDLVVVDEAALRKVAGSETPRGPAAVIAVPEAGLLGRRSTVVAWGLGDPGNVGTLIRTAAGFGWDFAHAPGTADPWSPKVLRAGAGGHFRIGITPVRSIEELDRAGLVTVATVVRGGVPPSQIGPGRYALLVGEEAAGLPAEVIEGAAVRLTIPMPGGTESLNAAMAAGIAMYELGASG